MPRQAIRPPDILGFQFAMREALDLVDPRERDQGPYKLLDEFVEAYRKLDEWKLKNNKAKAFSTGEACMHGDAPAIVISTTPVRVSVRKWLIPLRQAEFPMTGQVRWVDPGGLTKLGTAAKLDAWSEAMAMCGQEPAQWSTAEMVARIP